MLDDGVQVYRNRQWVVSDKGILSVTGVNGSYEYWIQKGRLKENWPEHMSEKRWVNVDAFIEAYLVACVAHGVKIPDIAERIAQARWNQSNRGLFARQRPTSEHVSHRKYA
jgi:hypothetical protein